eukprot:7900548-Lingulodinium_polyedra.AAC.1
MLPAFLKKKTRAPGHRAGHHVFCETGVQKQPRCPGRGSYGAFKYTLQTGATWTPAPPGGRI